jgi:hydroxymethylbilane synthase
VLDRVRIAARGSALALWQAHWVWSQLETHGVHVELVIVETQGDRETTAFREMQGQGFFTKTVQDAVLEGRADIAVHSLKDLPSAATPGLVIAAIPKREDAREVLLIHPNAVDTDASIIPVRANVRVGTSAVRRQAQLEHLRPDLERRELRGNVPTRIEKLRRGEYDAILLAHAGVKRLGLNLSDLEVRVLEPHVIVPAPGQGALALECRSTDVDLVKLLGTLDDAKARETVEAERGLMARLEGGCQLALGAIAQRRGENMELLAWYDGKSHQVVGSSPQAVAERAYDRIRASHPEAVKA